MNVIMSEWMKGNEKYAEENSSRCIYMRQRNSALGLLHVNILVQTM
jgi:hypothetical protein